MKNYSRYTPSTIYLSTPSPSNHTPNLYFTNIYEKALITIPIINVTDSSLPREHVSNYKNTIQTSKKNNNLQSTTIAPEYMWGNNTASTPSHTYRYQTITNIVAQPQKNTVDCSNFSNFTSDKIINNLHQNPDTILHTVQTRTNISTPLLKQNTILLISTDLIIPTKNYSRSQQPKKSSTQSNLLQHTYKKISNLDPYNINKS